MKKEKYIVTGMTCSACSSRVEKAVSKLEGIEKASVNLLTNSMQVEYDETKLNEEKIVQAVVDAGYGAERVATGRSGKTKNDSIVGAAAGKGDGTASNDNIVPGSGQAVDSSTKAKKPEENPAVKAAREAIAEMHPFHDAYVCKIFRFCGSGYFAELFLRNRQRNLAGFYGIHPGAAHSDYQ